MQLHLPIPELSSCSRHDLPIPAWSCAVKHRPPFPTLWKLLHGTDAQASHPGMKAASSSTTHGRTQYSCSRAQYFLSETKACCRLEEKEAVSFHTPSPSINQWDALQILLKHCFAFFFFALKHFKPFLKEQRRALRFCDAGFCSSFLSCLIPRQGVTRASCQGSAAAARTAMKP